MFREDILELSLPIVKDSQKSTHLARANSIALRGEWDILTIDKDKLSQPYGVINGTQNRTDVRLPCGPFLYGHHNSYKYLSVESCVLDHPHIGADKYAGYG